MTRFPTMIVGIRKIVSVLMASMFVLSVSLSIFSPQETRASSLSEVELAAYMLPDGTLPVLCNPEGEPHNHHGHGDCLGCCPCFGGHVATVDWLNSLENGFVIQSGVHRNFDVPAMDIAQTLSARGPPAS